MKRKTRLLLILMLAYNGSARVTAGNDKKVNPTLEDAFRGWVKGVASDNKEVRESTIRSMLPTKKDYEQLFQKHAQEVWPRHQKLIQDVSQKADETARMMAKGGAIKKFSTIDVRKEERLAEQYKWVLGVVPKDVPVANCTYELEKGKGRMGTFFYVNGRWIVIRDLDGFMP